MDQTEIFGRLRYYATVQDLSAQRIESVKLALQMWQDRVHPLRLRSIAYTATTAKSVALIDSPSPRGRRIASEPLQIAPLDVWVDT